MDLYVFLLVFTVINSYKAQAEQMDFELLGCSDTDQQYLVGLDGDELFHSDFIRKEGVETEPDFADPINFSGFYEGALAAMEACKHNLVIFIKKFNFPDEQLDPPVTFIYPKDDVVLDVDNSLICHMTGFFPPALNVSWAKNNKIVLKDTSLGQYHLNSDGTFNIFSALKFTPAAGDIYSCTVNHKSIQGQPETKIWEVDMELPRVAPTVFFGLGLSMGLLGVVAGTIFLIKGNNCN